MVCIICGNPIRVKTGIHYWLKNVHSDIFEYSVPFCDIEIKCIMCYTNMI